MRKTAFISTSAALFAAAGNASGATKSAANPAPASGAPAAADEGVKILAIRSDVAIPEIKSKRGSKSKYDFDKLEVGQSIGVIGRTAKSLNSTINGANRKYSTQKRDASTGEPLFEMTEIKDQNGNVTTRVPNKEKPVTEKTREFAAFDADPATDPDKATARIFRIK